MVDKKGTDDDRMAREATDTLTGKEGRNFGSLPVKRWESKSKKMKAMSMTAGVNYCPQTLSRVS